MTFTHVHFYSQELFRPATNYEKNRIGIEKFYASLVNLKLLCKVELIIKNFIDYIMTCLVTWIQFTDQIKDEETIFCTQVLQVLQLSNNVRHAGMTIISYMMS